MEKSPRVEKQQAVELEEEMKVRSETVAVLDVLEMREEDASAQLADGERSDCVDIPMTWSDGDDDV